MTSEPRRTTFARVLAGVLVSGTLVLPLAGVALADDGREQPRPQATATTGHKNGDKDGDDKGRPGERAFLRTVGIVSSLSGNTFTVTPTGLSAITFTITNETMVALPEGVFGLANGQKVTVGASAEAPTTALRILVHSADNDGDLATRTVGTASNVSGTTLTVTATDGTTTNFTLGGETSVTLPEGVVALANGQTVTVVAAKDNPSFALVIRVRAAHDDDDDVAVRARGVASNVSGTSVTVTPTNGAALTFTINSGTRIVLPEGVSGLANGQIITVFARADAPTVALRIRVKGTDDLDDEVLRIAGVASNVSSTGLTVTPAGGAAVSFTINGETEVVLPDGVTALANGQTVGVVARENAPTVAARIVVRHA